MFLFLMEANGLISEIRIELVAADITWETIDPPDPATWWTVNNIFNKK